MGGPAPSLHRESTDSLWLDVKLAAYTYKCVGKNVYEHAVPPTFNFLSLCCLSICHVTPVKKKLPGLLAQRLGSKVTIVIDHYTLDYKARGQAYLWLVFFAFLTMHWVQNHLFQFRWLYNCATCEIVIHLFTVLKDAYFILEWIQLMSLRSISLLLK